MPHKHTVEHIKLGAHGCAPASQLQFKWASMCNMFRPWISEKSRPRITSVLRILHTEEQTPPDLQETWLKRRAALKDRYLARQTTDRRANHKLVALSWSDFVEGKECSPRMRRIMRSNYKEMLEVIQKIVGDDIIGDELEEVSFELYKTASRAKIMPVWAKSDIPPIIIARVGRLDPVLWGSLCSLATKLYKWRGDFEVCGGGDFKTRESYQPGPNCGKELVGAAEYGESAHFSYERYSSARSLYGGMNLHFKEGNHMFEAIENTDSVTNRGGTVNPTWLLGLCANHIRVINLSGGVCAFGEYELAKLIVSCLAAGVEESQAQAELFNLLGEAGFSMMQELFENRDDINRTISEKDFLSPLKLGYISSAISMESVSAGKMNMAGAPGSNSVPGLDISVQTSAEKRATKNYKREFRRLQRAGLSDSDAAAILAPDRKNREEFAQPGLDPVSFEKSSHRSFIPPGKSLNLATAMSNQETAHASRTLPAGTRREMHKGWSEVFVPAPNQDSLEKDPTLIPVTDFPDWAQLAFKGTTSLNRMQSQVYQTAFHSSENMLVCAPTGAGKTNVAMMTVLKCIRDHMADGIINKDALKIIYVAPMKALAQEVVQKFSKQLSPLGLVCRELTGDMQLTKHEIATTQMIVTTPEKWDVVTRKGGLEGSLAAQVRLLIIDEVHLLADDRGAVIETLVARTLRQVEALQTMIRIVGLSATLPNYVDVGSFLRVNIATGLFYFDGRWRPVPLETRYIGVSVSGQSAQRAKMNEIAYEKAIASVRQGNQVMIFVHSRKDTVKTGHAIAELARKNGTLGLLDSPLKGAGSDQLQKKVAKSKNQDLKDLFSVGIGIHHAGMLRSDRNIMENAFSNGLTKILCCTATLAWGVNLPAHTVCIKGTEIYDSEKGGMKELGILDVQQIFGRAGRPQFDTSGEGIIITSHAMMNRYLSLMTRQAPIESQFSGALVDNLNAEIAGGTVTSVDEAVVWLSYTYLYIRMMRNPMAYGISYEEKEADGRLVQRRMHLIQAAAKHLDDARMARYDAKSGNLACTSLGRIASHYYLKHETITMFNEKLHPRLSVERLLDLICNAKELENVRVRDEELKELDIMKSKSPFLIKGGIENNNGKCNALLQGYISRLAPKAFTLVSDSMYIAQNAGRVTRGLFEICLRRGWPGVAETLLTLSKSIDKRIWWEPYAHPLRQFANLNLDLVRKLEERDCQMTRLYDLSANEIGDLVHFKRMGDKILDYVRQFPALDISVKILPITRTILRVEVEIYPDFIWSDRNHGNVQPWWIWMEDTANDKIYHSEYVLISKKQYLSEEPIVLVFTAPIFEPLPSQYCIRAESDRWLGASHVVTVSLKDLILPENVSPFTDLLDLRPLPKTALQNERFESLYSWTHFNPVQTQVFPTIFHSNVNVLLGAPTGSGKTVIAELAMMKLWQTSLRGKTVYIAPLKALARERHADWKEKYGPGSTVNKVVVQLTGDITPDKRALLDADIIITTPEKWDGVSRSWSRRSYVQKVELVIIDEIHLLGQDRGPVLEAVVSRTRNISAQRDNKIRLVGLSTALANARDLASWMGIKSVGLFNFRPSVRPVPLEVHISGFPGDHYCPRMATMNKPTYISIMTYSPRKPTLVFVSSRRQTRLTALDLISMCAGEENPRQFLNMEEEEVSLISQTCRDDALQNTLPFGIGIHHGGLCSTDRQIVERLFLEGKIQVLICTSTLAWGVNFPAHLVVIKGTEFYDGKTGRYVDFAITDILQMMGRAGRPQFDTDAVACVLIHEPKKEFYKKFLYEPFPVESQILKDKVLHDHMNAEVTAGVITSLKEGVDYLTWTYMFRRILQNPSYYGLSDSSDETIQSFLVELAKNVLVELQDSGCIEAVDDFKTINPLPLGIIASHYYISYQTAFLFYTRMSGWEYPSDQDSCQLLADSIEYDELPVRHNEDKINIELAKYCVWGIDESTAGDAHTKCFLLLQAYFFKIKLPMSDYITDTKSVLDQAMRLTNAMIDIGAYTGNLAATYEAILLSQKINRVHAGKGKPQMSFSCSIFLDQVEHSNDGPLVVGAEYTMRATVKTPEQAANQHSAKQSPPTFWILLGDSGADTLYCMKRFSLGRSHECMQRLPFSVSREGAQKISCTLISDAFPETIAETTLVFSAQNK